MQKFKSQSTDVQQSGFEDDSNFQIIDTDNVVSAPMTISQKRSSKNPAHLSKSERSVSEMKMPPIQSTNPMPVSQDQTAVSFVSTFWPELFEPVGIKSLRLTSCAEAIKNDIQSAGFAVRL